MDDKERGLYEKYNVSKTDGTPLDGECFVLRPDRDMAARAALLLYAELTSNRTLGQDIRAWISRIHSSAIIYQNPKDPIQAIADKLQYQLLYEEARFDAEAWKMRAETARKDIEDVLEFANEDMSLCHLCEKEQACIKSLPDKCIPKWRGVDTKVKGYG